MITGFSQLTPLSYDGEGEVKGLSHNAGRPAINHVDHGVRGSIMALEGNKLRKWVP
jgi:hypothetical protein